MNNKIAVLIPVFNNQEGLNRTLKSLEHAALGEGFTVVIVDDGSNECVIAPPNPPFNIYLTRLHKNAGITCALNTGIEYILDEGFEYIARIDAGDTCDSDRFAVQLKYLQEHPDCALVGSSARMCDVNGDLAFEFTPPTDDRSLRRSLHIRNVFLHPCLMFNSEAIRSLGAYSQEFESAEDYELIFRLSRKYKIGSIKSSLVTCELNPNGITISRRNRMLRSRIRLQLAYFDPWLIESYIGLLRSVLAGCFSSSFINAIKRLYQQGKRRPNNAILKQ